MTDQSNKATGSKRAREKSRITEIRYRRLFESARDGMLILDAVTRKIIDVNPFMAELTGYSLAEFLGKELWEIGLLKDKESSQDAFRELQEKGYIRYEDLPIQTKEGKHWEVEFISSVYWEEGRQVIQCNVRDVSARKLAEKERAELLVREREARKESEEANRSKDVFLATVSHELKTPLTAILGWARLLSSGEVDESKQAQAFETIIRNAKSQAQLIDDLLDVSRIITGKVRLDARSVELAPLIEATVDSMRPGAEAKAIQFQLLLDPDTGQISGDPDRLQQVVWNLLSNAIKFTPKGGQVEVRLEHADPYAEITVSDTGQGIKPEFLPQVFDRFRQANVSSTRQHKGLGLGLAIVRYLVELHGGTVQAESQGEGQGSIFKVKLPLMSPRGPQRGSTSDMAERRRSSITHSPLLECPPKLDGLRVLIVDDEADAREVVTTILERCGVNPRAASSVHEAVEMLENWRPDVLVADIAMPGEDGYALIRRVRSLPADRGGRTPALALTAYTRTEDRVRILLAGYQMHMGKPVEPLELMVAVAGLAGRTAYDASPGEDGLAITLDAVEILPKCP